MLLLPCRQAEEEGIHFEDTSSLLFFSSCQCHTAWITWLENSSAAKTSASCSSGSGLQSPPKDVLSGNRFIPTQGLKDEFLLTLGPGDADADPSRGEEPPGLVEVNCELDCPPLLDAALCCCGALAAVAPGWHSEICLGQWGPLEGHQGCFIFGLSDLRMPVSVDLNFMRLCVLGMLNILSAQFPKATENPAFPLPFRGSARRHPRQPLLWGMSLLTSQGYSQCWLPRWPPTLESNSGLENRG